jgi:para-aminobenzoate synthetase component 1
VPTLRGPIVRPIRSPVDHAALRAYFARRPGAFLLESVVVDPIWGRYSIYGLAPVRTMEIPVGVDPFPPLTEAVRSTRIPPADAPMPFSAGWVGWLAYEAGGFCEPRATPRRALAMMENRRDEPGGSLPLAHWALYDAALVCDHVTGQWFAAGMDVPGASVTPVEARLDELEGVASKADKKKRWAVPTLRPCTTDVTRAEYLDMVRRALDYIAAGDIFQVNLSQRFHLPYDGEPADLYERLCQTNPARFAAYLTCRDGAILSSSPELFLALRNGRVITRPIKGTIRRTGDPVADADRRAELAASEKDAAELAMIVDLERNDLGRVCRYGSVRVEHPGEIEALPTVFHRVATISGELRPGCDAIDLLRAAFPGGSITGAPKVRAMQIIDELERSPRGPYCGAIGYLGLDGSMMLNLAIRTMVWQPGCVIVPAGGGIVADSQPDAEYDETLAKAEGMLRALDDANPKSRGLQPARPKCATGATA